MSTSFLTGVPYDEIRKAVRVGDEEWIQRRKKAKAVSFLVQYGGGAKTASKQTGVSEDAVKRYITNYNRMYASAAKFSEDVKKEVQASRMSSGKRTASGTPAGVGFWRAPTGRLFSFLEVEYEDYLSGSTKLTFPMTQIKNYPIQGTGWDIVGLAMTSVDDTLHGSRAYLFNTVHDSLMYYVPEEDTQDFIIQTKKVLESVPKLAYDAWGWKMPEVEFPVDCKTGKNWMEMKEWKLV
jgi:DNA polymerase I-like protein with 3'-5' exonuclease and polymerase domains